MNHSEALLVVGAGTAGAELCVAARLHGWPGPIVLFGDEGCLPYHRPPLSKAYLSGEADAETLPMRAAAAYEKAGVTLRTDVRVASIDRAARSLRLADGGELGYAALALCTGGRPRRLALEQGDGEPAPGEPPNLHYLRSRADADALRPQLAAGRRLAIVGGGYVGLEVAASARKAGAEVLLIEAQPRLLARVAGAELSRFYEEVHAEAGVDIRCGRSVAQAPRDAAGRIESLVLDDGSRIEVDAVVAGIGMLPNVELAQGCGLEIDGGIAVDACSRTADPHIWAAGDCTVQHSALYERRVRLESVPNALEQARAAALSICGKPRANHSVPWFWSDQYALKLQMAGLSQGHDRLVLRGSTAQRSFLAFYLLAGRLIAVDSVNRPAEFMVARKMVEARLAPDPDALADAGVALRSLLPAGPAATPARSGARPPG